MPLVADGEEEFQSPPKTFIVRIERENRRKPYLGGFRNRMTNIEYHHASAQTARMPVRQMGPEKFTRECQTQILQTRSIQTTRESGSQMSRNDLYLDSRNDREIVGFSVFCVVFCVLRGTYVRTTDIGTRGTLASPSTRPIVRHRVQGRMRVDYVRTWDRVSLPALRRLDEGEGCLPVPFAPIL